MLYKSLQIGKMNFITFLPCPLGLFSSQADLFHAGKHTEQATKQKQMQERKKRMWIMLQVERKGLLINNEHYFVSQAQAIHHIVA